MSVYVVVQLAVHDRERYDRYTAAFLPTLAPHRGRVLAADDRPEVFEGGWTGNRMVLLEFPDRDTFVGWADSPEYQAIIGDRHGAADSTVTLVHGF